VESGDLQVVFSLIFKSLQQVDLDAEEFIANNLPDDLRWLESELEQVVHEGTTQDRILEDLARTLLMLRKIKVNEKIKNLLVLQQPDEEEQTTETEPAMQKELLESIKMRALVEQAQSSPLIGD
jgi:hypothetical protein